MPGDAGEHCRARMKYVVNKSLPGERTVEADGYDHSEDGAFITFWRKPRLRKGCRS